MKRPPIDILLVDDDVATAEMYAAGLRRSGWNVALAADGLQALQTAWQHQPRLVLLDVRLPELDGLTVLRHLRQPMVVMLSNSETEEVVAQALQDGAHAFWTKYRTTPAQLAARVATLLHAAHVDVPAGAA